MSAPTMTPRGTRLVSLWMLCASVLTVPAFAQTAPASSASSMGDMSGMTMDTMPGMDMTHEKHDRHGAPPAKPVAPARATSAQPAAASSSMGDMSGMDMADDQRFGKVLINQLEWTHAGGVSGQAWDAYAGYGSDSDKLVIRTEGDRAGGRVEAASVEALWSHAYATFWDSVVGVRHDFGIGPGRDWAAFGVQGIAPYWFNLEATGYVGAGGRTAARFKAEYELLITQRLILQPELETNLYGRSDPARRLGPGLSDASLGLRLRYEIRREFAPYVGVVWQRVFGGTAGFRRAESKSVFDRQIVAGVRVGF